MKALKVTVDWAEMDLFAATLKELNDDENIFAYQIDTLTGIVVCENECGLENIKSLDPLLYSHLTHQKYIRIK